ncbi:pilus assembly protein PilB [Anoxybacillus flavithermus]|uniref:pilus assembly protein PilB n=1 Tax=Anoxybacillus flavithermus TaxID=33934 RepID=UPI001868D539|nr:pilus assembly protein PilB [Anoxybacillus flavithermus]MBE2925527.1 pilus assembly protein PilB [Anoxybacillus flavithermus]MBE2947086.1 pilus assembly protein PilB [Anoxybacillus flavithermus]MBE2949902.1 pilus assembly protein PilB [Anoxybacillus flavithermus]
MKKSYKVMILLLPIIVALVTTLSVQFIEGTLKSELLHFTMFENLMMFTMIFLTIYLFTIAFVVPINIYITKKIDNKLISFVLFNIVGLILIGCVDIWVLKNFGNYSLR